MASINLSKLHILLAEEMEAQYKNYLEVTAFAKMFHQYSHIIVSRAFTADMYCNFADQYKTLPLAWGICWNPHMPTNYPYDKMQHKGYVSVYINCMSLFGDNFYHPAIEELAFVKNSIRCFYYDNMNSTFYFLPEELPDGLEKLHDWYVATKAKIEPYLKQKKKEELEKQLKALED